MPIRPAPPAARRSKLAAAGILSLCGFLPSPTLVAEAASTPLFSDDGYRLADFRTPVPQSVPDGTTIDTAQARRLFDAGKALFIDVLPAPERPDGLAPGALWLPLPRYNIPGSVWLPNVGYGRLSGRLEAYFKGNLRRLSDGDRSKPMVIYCLADCWMSWNAARRAAGYGYTQVYWYPDGTSGWKAAALPLEKSTPLPLNGR